jgi:hypothetical protein
MTLYHREEALQGWALYHYELDHPGTIYQVVFADGESYLCVFDTIYESDNAGELDIEDDNPLYDEFVQASMEILETVQKGLRPYNQWLNLDYRDWPVLIKDIATGALVYDDPTG